MSEFPGGTCPTVKSSFVQDSSATYFDAGLFSEPVMPAALPAGDHPFAFAEAFSNIDELLVLSAPEADRFNLSPKLFFTVFFPPPFVVSLKPPVC